MALIYPTIWEQGDKREQLTSGYHYKKEVLSLVVPQGQQVTIYENEDRTGKKSYVLYEGTYHHLYFYDIGERPGVIHVEENGLTALDIMEIGWWSTYDEEKSKQTKGKEGRYPMYYALPTGDWRGGPDFPNDKIQWVYLPFGMTAELFDDGQFKDSGLIFSGNKQGEKERYNLWDFHFGSGSGSASWMTSSIKARADKWISAGVEIRGETIKDGQESRVVATTTLFNNTPHTATISKEISASVEESTSEDWNIGGSVAAKAGFEAGPEVCKVTGELEVTISGGYGESTSKAESREITDIASVEVVGYGNAKASMIVEYGTMEGIAVRKWRNTRNNVIIEQEGKISSKRANKAEVEISEVK